MGKDCGCVASVGCLVLGIVIGAILVFVFYPRWQERDDAPEEIEMRDFKEKARQAIDAVPDSVRLKPPAENGGPPPEPSAGPIDMPGRDEK